MASGRGRSILRRFLLGAVLVVVALVGIRIALVAHARREPPPRKEVAWLRPDSLGRVVPLQVQERIRGADEVHAFLIDPRVLTPEDTLKSRVTPPLEWGYAIRSPAAFLSKEQATRLRTTMLDLDSYQTEMKTCTFQPTVAYVFKTHRDSATVLICHDCDQMNCFSGTERSAGEVDPVAESLVGLTHELFPGDTLVTGIWRRKPDSRWWPLSGTFH